MEPKQIATLPPIEVLTEPVITSEKTGQPPRIAWIVIVQVMFYVASVWMAVGYAAHWWAAVHPDRFPRSAQLIVWMEPAPGKWLALTLVASLAIFTAVAVTFNCVSAHQSWNGWRWSRWAGLVAVALNAGMAVLFDYSNWLWWVPCALAAVGTVSLWLPPASRYFRTWQRFRHEEKPSPLHPQNVYYGRVARYR